jgi:hypothetical protein
MRYWKRVDERLIKGGIQMIALSFVKNYQAELLKMNEKKR